MSHSYTVVEPFIVMRDGKAVHYVDVGSQVELSDDEAALLLDAGKVLPHVTVTVDGVEVQGEIASRPDDAEPGVQLDPEGVADPLPDLDDSVDDDED
ncbi:hypothetical protein [Mycolicibacterium goodii]|uniref:hypothetical protein n=1 Tax=Mycolicibacterium goodii TaxID=134601 RepID=UPI001BDD1595|nr:hypothetical protein [Mycolicibacterium goodii]MBU8833602.1 hypothetical protein [Mycolicibacterium goodii]